MPLDVDHFVLARNLQPARCDALLVGRDLVKATVPGKVLLFTGVRWRDLRERVLASFQAYQQKNPESFGTTTVEVLRMAPAPDRPALSAALDALVAEKAVDRFGQLLPLPGHAVRLSLDEENVWSRSSKIYGPPGSTRRASR